MINNQGYNFWKNACAYYLNHYRAALPVCSAYNTIYLTLLYLLNRDFTWLWHSSKSFFVEKQLINAIHSINLLKCVAPIITECFLFANDHQTARFSI